MPDSCHHNHSFVLNARILRADPTRTTMIRRRFMADVSRRFAKVASAVRDFMADKDALGLAPRKLTVLVERRQYEFLTDDAKLTAFNDWFREQVDAGILTLPETTPFSAVTRIPGNGASWTGPWTGKYVISSYRMGLLNAYLAARQGEVTDQAQEEFMRSAFGAPETTKKIKFLATRSFEQFKGVTAQMGANMNRILAQGMADGKNPVELSKEMTDSIGISRNRALTIARTEVIHVHAEGQLDGFEELGVKELGVKAEWSTAGDSRVCPLCLPLEGRVFEIDEARGMIPLHPNCRCSWIPHIPEKKKKRKGLSR